MWGGGQLADQVPSSQHRQQILEKVHALYIKWCEYVLASVGRGGLSAEGAASKVKAVFVFRAEPSGGPSPRCGVAQAPWWRITVNNCVVGCQRHLAWCWAGWGQPLPLEPGLKHSAMKGYTQKTRKRDSHWEHAKQREILQNITVFKLQRHKKGKQQR